MHNGKTRTKGKDVDLSNVRRSLVVSAESFREVIIIAIQYMGCRFYKSHDKGVRRH